MASVLALVWPHPTTPVRVDLINPANSIGIGIKEWIPQISDYKQGGVFQDSPLAASRRLVYGVDGSVTEKITVAVTGYVPDDVAAYLQSLRQVLRLANDYWLTDWQNYPVHLEAQSDNETNMRYALLVLGKAPNDDFPYGTNFVIQDPTFDNIQIEIERAPGWLESAPGTGTCVQISSTQTWDYGLGLTQEASAPPNAKVTSIVRHGSSGNLYAGSLDARIMRSTNNGDTWSNNLTVAPVPNAVNVMLTLANNNILAGGEATAAGVRAIARTTNDGGAWLDVSNATMSTIRDMVQVASTGTIIAVGATSSAGINAGIWRSTNNGSSFTAVATDYVSGTYFTALLVTTNNNILAITETGIIYRSTNDGVSWSYYSKILVKSGMNRGIRLSNGDLILTNLLGFGLWKSTDSGLNWSLLNIGNISGIIWSIIEPAAGTLYALIGTAPRYLARSVDGGRSWQRLAIVVSSLLGDTIPDSLLYVSSLNRIIIGLGDGVSGYIYRTAALTTISLGRSSTCANEVFTGNNDNTANLTHIFRDDSGAFGSILPATLPVNLFNSATLTGNDALYFGVSNLTNSRPFSSLVFDLSVAVVGIFTIAWEYWSGAAWSALTTNDQTDGFRRTGVLTVHWAIPSNWASTTVNGVTGMWIRARVTGVGGLGTVTVPVQANRDIYTVNNAFIDVAQVGGDIPAMVKIKAYNQSDVDGPGGATPNLYTNRLIVGSRSIVRGASFRAYLNLSNVQNTPGIVVTVGTSTSFVADITSPGGIRATYNPGGVESMATRVTISLDPGLMTDFYGTYHAFLRGRRTAGAVTDITVRLQVVTGSGGIVFTSKSRQLQSTTAFEVLDFGQITIPASGLFKQSEMGDITQIHIQASAASGTPDLYLYDLVLVPTDEWAGDFVDYANESESDIGRSGNIPKFLDIDSVTDPSNPIRSIVKTADGSEFITAQYTPIANGPAILQTGSDQRLWFFAMQTSAIGTSYQWLAPPEIVHSVQVLKQSRYYSLRGNS